MSVLPRLLLALCALSLSGILPAAGAEPDPQPRARFGPCPEGLPTARLPGIRCGSLDVPEDYARPQGRRIRIPFAILPATERPRQPDPVVFLQGGPGGGAFAALAAAAAADRVTLLDPRRDLILTEYRGAGLARPRLTCNRQGFTRADSLSGVQATEASARACIADLRRIADPRQYRSEVVAKDARSLRIALGLKSWNLYGESWGTLTAARLMRLDPEATRAVLLDGPLSPALGSERSVLLARLDLLTKLGADCARQPDCRRRLPRLTEALKQSLLALQAAPLTGQPLPQPVTLESFYLVLSSLIMAPPEGVALTPALIDAVARRDAAAYARVLAALPQGRPDPVTPLSGSDTSTAQALVALCQDQDTAGTYRQPLGTLEPWPDLVLALEQSRDLDPVCRGLGLPRSPVEEAAIIDSPLPVLLLAGKWDRTDLRSARRAAGGFSKAQVVEMERGGHTSLDSQTACTLALARQFYGNPDRPLDLGCVARQAPIRFRFP